VYALFYIHIILRLGVENGSIFHSMTNVTGVPVFQVLFSLCPVVYLQFQLGKSCV